MPCIQGIPIPSVRDAGTEVNSPGTTGANLKAKLLSNTRRTPFNPYHSFVAASRSSWQLAKND